MKNYDPILEKAYYWDEDYDKVKTSPYTGSLTTPILTKKKRGRKFKIPSLKINNYIKNNEMNTKLTTPWLGINKYIKQCQASEKRQLNQKQSDE